MTDKTFKFLLQIVCGFLFVFECSLDPMFAQKFSEEEIWSGNEDVVRADLDTTRNWWIITTPFTNQYRLIVNHTNSVVCDSIQEPVFSPDGNVYAALVIYKRQWHIIIGKTEKGSAAQLVPLDCNDVYSLNFSGDSQTLYCIGLRGGDEYLLQMLLDSESQRIQIIQKRESSRIVQRSSIPVYSYNARRWAVVVRRGASKFIQFNSEEIGPFDDAKIIGIWATGELLYAYQIGGFWTVKKAEEEIVSGVQSIDFAQINREQSAATFCAKTVHGSNVYVISDNYSQPLRSSTYNAILSLSLHPYLPQSIFTAKHNAQYLVVTGTLESGAGQFEAPIARFTAEGKEFWFAHCENNYDCFITINGERLRLDFPFKASQQIVKAEKSDTFAYGTASTLAVRNYKTAGVISGFMVDNTGPIRWNRFTRCYELLGTINKRVYLVRCQL